MNEKKKKREKEDWKTLGGVEFGRGGRKGKKSKKREGKDRLNYKMATVCHGEGRDRMGWDGIGRNEMGQKRNGKEPIKKETNELQGL